jgi:protein-tyrosine phosphatase
MNTDVRAQGEDAWATLRADPTAANLHRAVCASYQTMPNALMPHIRAISEALIVGEVPMLINCTAGKDRTGVAVALFLALLNVSETDILADYRKSAEFMNNPRMRASVEQALSHGLGETPSAELMQEMLGIDDMHLLTALSSLAKQWDDARGYFLAAGVTEDCQERLRLALLH